MLLYAGKPNWFELPTVGPYSRPAPISEVLLKPREPHDE